MKIEVIATGNVKSIQDTDFEKLKELLEELRLKYEIEVVISNFMVDYKQDKQKPTDEDDSFDEWWRELTKRQIDYLLVKER